MLRLLLPSLAGLALLAAPAAFAQQFSYGADAERATQALSFGYFVIDFEYDGEGTPPLSFAFSEPAYGVVYTRPNFFASLAYGTQSAADPARDARTLRLLDATITTWGEIFLANRRAERGFRVSLPIALHTNYRRVSPEGEENSLTESFNVTVLGLGAGLGVTFLGSERVTLEARATPILGLAVRSFGDSAGSARLLDTDVQLHLGQLAGRFGVSVGYGFRYQVWNGTSSTLLSELTEDLFDYKGRHHLLRVGVNW